jgi:hypothetical protein
MRRYESFISVDATSNSNDDKILNCVNGCHVPAENKIKKCVCVCAHVLEVWSFQCNTDNVKGLTVVGVNTSQVGGGRVME